MLQELQKTQIPGKTWGLAVCLRQFSFPWVVLVPILISPGLIQAWGSPVGAPDLSPTLLPNLTTSFLSQSPSHFLTLLLCFSSSSLAIGLHLSLCFGVLYQPALTCSAFPCGSVRLRPSQLPFYVSFPGMLLLFYTISFTLLWIRVFISPPEDLTN